MVIFSTQKICFVDGGMDKVSECGQVGIKVCCFVRVEFFGFLVNEVVIICFFPSSFFFFQKVC